jgi:hypothetical protein
VKGFKKDTYDTVPEDARLCHEFAAINCPPKTVVRWRGRYFMVKPLVIADRAKLFLRQPVVQWHTFSDKNPDLVVVTASIQPESTPKIDVTSGFGYSLLAVEMTPQVAMRLHEQLGELGRRMGWLAKGESELA